MLHSKVGLVSSYNIIFGCYLFEYVEILRKIR